MSNDYSNPIRATLSGVGDLFRKRATIGSLAQDDRLDGKTVLITGANSGLGKATAIGLLRRGARVILACRSGIPQAGDEIARAAGSTDIDMLHVDLADLHSVTRLARLLRDRGDVLHRVVLNAGLVPRTAERSAQGFEIMFAVHYLANTLLLRLLLADGVIPNASQAGNGIAPAPRVIFVSSETHRSGRPLDLATLGAFHDYGAMGGISEYGHSKLAMTASIMDLARQMMLDDRPDVAFHAVCPGPVNSNIARDAPAVIRPVLRPIMRLLFASPEQASTPLLYLCCAAQLNSQTGLYLHLMTRKEPAAQASDPSLGAELRAVGRRLLSDALAKN